MTVSLSVFVCLCVRNLFFSFSVLEVSSSPKEFQGCLRFKGSFKDVSRKFQGCLLKVPWVFLGSLKGFYGSLKSVSWKIQECFKKVSGKY